MEYNLELFHPREKSANFLLFICIYYCWLLAFLGAYGLRCAENAIWISVWWLQNCKHIIFALVEYSLLLEAY